MTDPTNVYPLIQELVNPLEIKYPETSIRQSNIHGRGVFVCEDIDPLKVVTCYPIQYIESLSSGFPQKGSSTDFVRCRDYALHKEEFMIYGDPDILDPTKLGHMVNDPVGNTFKNCHDIRNGISRYAVNFGKANCVFVTGVIPFLNYIVSIKPIEKNDEITVCYDPLYWYNRLPSVTPDLRVEMMLSTITITRKLLKPNSPFIRQIQLYNLIKKELTSFQSWLVDCGLHACHH